MKPRDLNHERNHRRKAGPHGPGGRPRVSRSEEVQVELDNTLEVKCLWCGQPTLAPEFCSRECLKADADCEARLARDDELNEERALEQAEREDEW
jgi:hypothetical protein